jgi:hypothetical protein
MVTSSTNTALSLHAPVVDAVPFGVPGVVVVDASRVEVGGISVGRDKPDLVGTRVDVTNRGGASVTGSCATLIQDDNIKDRSRIDIQIFFIERFYFEKIRIL